MDEALDIILVNGEYTHEKRAIATISQNIKTEYDIYVENLTIKTLSEIVVSKTGLHNLLKYIDKYLSDLSIVTNADEFIEYFEYEECGYEWKGIVTVYPRKSTFTISIFKLKTPYPLHFIKDGRIEILPDSQFVRRELLTYKKVIDNSFHLSITNSEGTITYINETFCKLSGYSRDELIGNCYRLMKSDFHSSVFFSRLWDTIQSGETWKGEFKNIAKNGTEYWIETTIVPFLDTEGKPYQYAAFSRNITDHKLMELQLAESEYKYGCLFEYSPIPMWIYDVETLKFIEVNKAAVDTYGYSFEEFKEMTLMDIRPESEIPVLLDAIHQVKAKGYSHSSNLYTHKIKDGSLITVKIDSSIIYLNNRKGEIIIATNVTKEQNYKNEVEELNNTLLNAQALAELGYWRRNLDAKNIFWSQQMFKIFEIEPADFNGSMSQMESFFHPDDRYILQMDFFKIVSDNGFYNFQHRIITPDKKIKWLDSTVKLISNEKGEPKMLEGVVIDITQKHNAILEIKYKNKLINALNRFSSTLLLESRWEDALKVSFEIIGNAVGVDRVYYFENHEDEKTKQQLCSQKIEWTREDEQPQIDNPELQNCPHELFQDFFTELYTGRNFTAITHQLPQGRLRHTLEEQSIRSILIVPIFTDSYFKGFVGFDDCKKDHIWNKDEIIFLKTIATNLEAFFNKRKVETAFNDKVVQLNTIIENVKGIAYRCTNENLFPIKYLSDEFERLTGYCIHDFTKPEKPFSFYDLFMDEDRDIIIDALKSCKSTAAFELECRLISKDKKGVWVKLNGRSITENNNGNYYIDGIMIDITNSKEKDEKLKEIAWSQSHLVRAPLANILGLVNLVQQKFGNSEVIDEELNTYIHLIMKSAEDLDNVIKDNVKKTVLE